MKAVEVKFDKETKFAVVVYYPYKYSEVYTQFSGFSVYWYPLISAGVSMSFRLDFIKDISTLIGYTGQKISFKLRSNPKNLILREKDVYIAKVLDVKFFKRKWSKFQIYYLELVERIPFEELPTHIRIITPEIRLEVDAVVCDKSSIPLPVFTNMEVAYKEETYGSVVGLTEVNWKKEKVEETRFQSTLQYFACKNELEVIKPYPFP